MYTHTHTDIHAPAAAEPLIQGTMDPYFHFLPKIQTFRTLKSRLIRPGNAFQISIAQFLWFLVNGILIFFFLSDRSDTHRGLLLRSIYFKIGRVELSAIFCMPPLLRTFILAPIAFLSTGNQPCHFSPTILKGFSTAEVYVSFFWPSDLHFLFSICIYSDTYSDLYYKINNRDAAEEPKSDVKIWGG